MKKTIFKIGLAMLVLASCKKNQDVISPNVRQEASPAFGYGFVSVSKEEYASFPKVAPANSAARIENYVDLSAKFPTPGDQGSQGSCVGWGSSYLKAYQENRENNTTGNAYVFSASYIYNQIKVSSDCGSGTYVRNGLNILRDQGCALTSVFPYQSCANIPNSTVVASAYKYRAQNWYAFGMDGNLVNNIRANLSGGTPVIIGIHVDQAFQGFHGNGVFTSWNNVGGGGHCLVVIGYDDTRQAFRLINSWGTSWGDAGYVWLSYGAFVQNTSEAYVLSDTKTTDNTAHLYRSYNGKDHFYTTSMSEVINALGSGYNYEGIASEVFKTQLSGTTPLYRLFGGCGEHFYTTDWNTVSYLVGAGTYSYEGIPGYVYTSQAAGSIPLYRRYNGCDHFYSIDINEGASYSYEGVAGYVTL